MKTTSLIQLLALPATLAFVQLEIVVKEGVEGVKAAAKGDEARIQVTGADTYEKDGLRCLNDDHKWTSECQNRPKHRKIGESYFTDVPKDPQPFTIAIQEQQDQKDDGMRSCNWTVTGAPTGENYYVWDVSEEWMGEGHDGVDVKCGPVVTWGEIKSQSVSDAEVLASMGLGPNTSAD